ncbi:MAG: aromatic ring-hydroxylating dioxygenase subunit alpha [Proteobacteria bacterium]|nr:aromatic ring-hydroxylating dioxygenase subunit alpha [Pseudomonadota bacterium]
MIKNTWYVAAEPGEIATSLLSRLILGVQVVIGRTESGQAFALEDRCPHRFAPLSLGRVVGERLQCGYHGAEFNPAGQCVSVPGQANTPSNAHVRSFPVVEKQGYIWIWMGDPELAGDLRSIPACFYRSDDPAWVGGYGHFESLQVNFNLINDNLFDITHAEFVHPESFGAEEMRIYRNAEPGEAYIDQKTTYTIAEREIVFRMQSLNMPGGPFYRWMVATSLGKNEYTGPVDLDMEVSWAAPTYTSFLLNARPAGQPREQGVQVCNMHSVTPASDFTSHYFYRSVKDYGPAELVEPFMQGVKAIFE